jgi:hypothetical protein
VAERHNKHNSDSRIIEFFDAHLRVGGLIEFRRHEGKLLVMPYRLDDKVEVVK